MSRTWTLLKAWSKDLFLIVIVMIILWMAHEPLLSLLDSLQWTLLAPLSKDGVGAFILILSFYLLKLEWDYRRIYVPRSVSLWLFLLLGIYLYCRHWGGPFPFWPISFSFWEIPYLRKLAWSDLLLFPWGGAFAIALRSRSKKEILFLGIVLVGLLALLYFLHLKHDRTLLREVAISILLATCPLLWIYPWLSYLSYWEKSQSQRQEERRGVMLAPAQADVSSQPIDTDNAALRGAEDWLSLLGIAKVLQENLKELDLSKSSLTVGITAPWGKGKSSFINLLKERLEKEKAIIISFNPRASKSVSSIQEDFFDAFAEELSRHYLGFALLLARYTKHLGLLDQYEWTRPLGSLFTLILPGKEQEAVNRSLRELGRRVYVVIDDLDRLSGEEILEVLKLIDRNASFSNTVFITAYDKAYVDNVLKSRLDHGLSHSFIDKYISMEVPLPEPTKERMKGLMWLFMSTRIKTSSSGKYRQIYEAWNRVADIVVASLDSIRDLKRYLNQVLPRYNESIIAVELLDSEDLVYEDYLLLHLLCYKDLSVYVALSSRRILRLDPSTRSYTLVPNLELEEELKQISQWEGSKSILEKLFDPREVERATDVDYKPLRSQEGFDRYFRVYTTMDQNDSIEILLRIIHSTQMQAPNKEIDDMIKELGIGGVAWELSKLIGEPCVGREDRSITIKLGAYVVYRYNYNPDPDPTHILHILGGKLIHLFTRKTYLKYKELGIIQNISEYRRLLLPMIFYVIRTQPIRTAHIIDDVVAKDGRFKKECIYSIPEIAEILLKCQKNYYQLWEGGDRSREHAQSFIFKEYMKDYPQYVKRALQQLISLIQRYPSTCAWVILLTRSATTPNASCFQLASDKHLLQLLEKQGFTLKVWLDLIGDLKLRYLLEYAKSANKKEYFRRIEFLPDEEADLHSIDYVYRAVLAQEERERQQASSEG